MESFSDRLRAAFGTLALKPLPEIDSHSRHKPGIAPVEQQQHNHPKHEAKSYELDGSAIGPAIVAELYAENVVACFAHT